MIPNGPNPLARRRFLEYLAAAGAAGAGAAALAGCSRHDGVDRPLGAGARPTASASADRADPTAGVDAEPVGRVVPGAVADRVLVVVDLQGGNDGLSTLVPYADPIYRDLRPTLAVPDEDVLVLDDQVGLHPSLTGLHRRGVTTVEGVGPIDGDLSHFAMTERWERGDARGDGGLRTGFLGRLTDALDDGSPLVGVALGEPSPHLVNRRAATLAMSDHDALWFLQEHDWAAPVAYQRGVERFDDRAGELAGVVVDSFARLGDLATRLDTEGEEPDWESPMLARGGWLGQRLHLAADLLAADVGTRVVYLSTGDYDTHQDHVWRQAENLAEVDAAVDGFLAMVDRRGLADRVLVATISEFGRRVGENGSGLDHGSGSTMLLAGPVGDARLGERPGLDDLDDDGNLRSLIGFDRYLATLAQEWLGVEAASVLPGTPEPLGIF